MAPVLSKPTLFLGLLATHALAVPASLKRDELTCFGNPAEGQTYEGENGTFDIECGVDYAGGDMGKSSVANFETCIQECDADDQCVDVAFVYPNACYTKNVLTSAVTNQGVWSAKKQVQPYVPDRLSCDQNKSNGKNWAAENGDPFDVQCGVDYAGGDMYSVDVASFEQCIDLCATEETQKCIDVSYVNGACYLKNTLNAPTEVSYVWTAKRSGYSPAAAQVPVCPSKDGQSATTSAGSSYTILCGTDYAGGNFLATTVDTYQGCLDECDKHDDCKVVSYVAPSCYLKNIVTSPQAVSYVVGGFRNQAAEDDEPTITEPEDNEDPVPTDDEWEPTLTEPEDNEEDEGYNTPEPLEPEPIFSDDEEGL